jgi:hypothetical protein
MTIVGIIAATRYAISVARNQLWVATRITSFAASAARKLETMLSRTILTGRSLMKKNKIASTAIMIPSLLARERSEPGFASGSVSIYPPGRFDDITYATEFETRDSKLRAPKGDAKRPPPVLRLLQMLHRPRDVFIMQASEELNEALFHWVGKRLVPRSTRTIGEYFST